MVSYLLQAMRTIELTQGYKAIVDNADYEMLTRYRWMALVSDRPAYVYAVTRMPETGRTLIRMHRFLCGLKPNDPREVDHRNGDTLDYRRENLRICTHKENRWNSRKQRFSTASNFKGVVRTPFAWVARLQWVEDGERKAQHLGSFRTEQEAAAAYDDAIKQ
jgi:hypothetical protein